MTILRLLTLLVLLAIASTQPNAASEAPTSETWPAAVGNSQLSLPVPTGFVEAAAISPEVRVFGERMLPPTHRLLAFFVKEGDVQAVRTGQSVSLRRYFQVQTLRQFEMTNIETADFQQVRELIRSQNKQLIAAATVAAQQHVDITVAQMSASNRLDLKSLNVGEMRPLDVFIDKPDAISLIALTKFSAETSFGRTEVPLIAAVNTALVSRKLVYFYAYSTYSGEEDIAWARAQSVEWLNRAQPKSR